MKIRHSLFFRFFWTLVALGVIPMAIASAFLVATYQVEVAGILGSDLARDLILKAGIQFILIFLFVLIIATFAAFTISRNISKPLSVLTEAVRLIAGGNLKVKIYVKRKDEIGVLGDFFNEMVGRIKEAKDRQEEISRLKTEFISVAAHQLRTPLSVMKWAHHAILEGDMGRITKDQKDILEKAAIANESMINLVHNLLDAARIEEGRFGYAFQHTDLIEFLNKLLAEKKLFAQGKNINLIINKNISGSIIINADSDKLSIAVGNIIDNAIRYTASGGRVEVGLDTTDSSVTVSITDTGIGIAPEDKARLFTKFYRGSNVMHLETEGTGLGLFITKNIILSHGGDIWFNSEKSRGTVFFIKLPKLSSPKSPTKTSFESFVGAI